MQFTDYSAYPATVAQNAEGRFIVMVSAFERVVGEGRSKEEAIENAVSAFGEKVSRRLRKHHKIPPAPQCQEGEELLPLPFAMTMKLIIRNIMLDKGMTQRDLAASVGSTPQIVTQTLDFGRTRTSTDVLLAYLKVLGMRLDISLAED